MTTATLSPQQAQKLQEIGEKLRQTRESKSIALQQITASTLIAERHLRAIEEGNFDSLPEPIYIRGFIHKYGTVVGMAGIAEEFPLANVLVEEKPTRFPVLEFRPYHLYAIYVAVIAGSLTALSMVLGRQPQQVEIGSPVPAQRTELRPAPKPVPTPKVESVKPVLAPSPAPTPSAATQANATTRLVDWLGTVRFLPQAPQVQEQSVGVPTAALKPALEPEVAPMRLALKPNGETWVRVAVDGQLAYEGLVTDEMTSPALQWQAEREVSISAADGSKVFVILNDRPPALLGDRGQEVAVVVTPEFQPPEVGIKDVLRGIY
jgi:cytoskeletal protein RodZ